MRLASLAFLLLTLSVQSSVAVPTKRGPSDPDCPFLFNSQGKPSLDDLTDNGKPHDMGSLAIAAALVNSSPRYVASLFKYRPEQDSEIKEVPTDAKLRPAEGESSCQPRAVQAFLFESEDEARDSNGIFVDLHGSPDVQFNGGYLGDELYDLGDNAHSSAWVYILQYTLLYHAREDAEAGHKWINTDAVAAAPGLPGSVQEFNQLAPQKYDNLKHMLGLVVGKETSWKPISDLSVDELRKTLDAASKSPVLVIPKEGSTGLDATRIWVATHKVANKADKWEFVNPIEKHKGLKELSLDELKKSVESLVFMKDHGALDG